MNWFRRLFSIDSAADQSGAASSPKTSRTPQAEELLRRLGSHARPAIHLQSGNNDDFSRFGGLPDMPAALEWPVWKGKPLGFLAQIDLAAVHAALPSFHPEKGRLYFFFDSEQGVWGGEPDDIGAWRVLFAPENLAVRHREAPEDLPDEGVFDAKSVTPVRINLLPDSSRLPEAEFDWNKDGETYHTLRHKPFRGGPTHQMLGFPSPVQSDDMEEDCELFLRRSQLASPTDALHRPKPEELKAGAAKWRLLLQLDTDNDTGWMWGDAGTLYFWVRESDARSGDFSKVWMVLQCC